MNDTARNDLGSLEQLVPRHEATYEPAEVLTISQTVVMETSLPLTLVQMRLQSQAKGEKQPAMR
jgi:hypothetical protein